MAIPIEKYFQDNLKEKRASLKIKNDDLDLRLSKMRKEWLLKSEILIKRLLKMNLCNNIFIDPIKINELEGDALVLHESLRKEIRKMINQLGKAINSKKILSDESNIFYSLRMKELNMGRSTKFIDLMVTGVTSEKKRTCLLLEVYIDFLDELKDTVYNFKFKIRRTINLATYVKDIPLKKNIG